MTDQLPDAVFTRCQEIELQAGADLGGFMFVIHWNSMDDLANKALVAELTTSLLHPVSPDRLPSQHCVMWGRDGQRRRFDMAELRQRLWSAPLLQFMARGVGADSEFIVDPVPTEDAARVRDWLLAPRRETLH